jgi:nucleotide-binding universal stress UspA family protein
MFKRIAVGYDGSATAEGVLAFAVDLARRSEASLVLIHVDEEIIAKGGGPLLADEDEIEAIVQRKGEGLSADGLDVTVRTPTVRLGGPGPAIADVAEEEGADLIVVGTRGLSAIKGVMLGSVTHRLLHVAATPVLVLTPNAEPTGNAIAAATTTAAA